MDRQRLEDWEADLLADVTKLRTSLERKEEELRHVQRLRELQDGERTPIASPALIPVLPKQSSGRVSIAPLHASYFESNGRQYRTPGDLLDEMGEPHYFSSVRGGQGDAAQRKILIWARRNPVKARVVKVVLRDGRSFSLWDIADKNR